MLTRNLTLTLIFLMCLITISCRGKDESGQSPIDNRLLGKWNVMSKTDTEKIGDKEVERERELYSKGEKTYEFTDDNKLIIVDGHGRGQTTLPTWMTDGKLFIGQDHPNKAPYTVTFSGNRATLIKVEQEKKDSQTVTETEEVILER